MEGEVCPICFKKDIINLHAFKCDLCCKLTHRNCTLFTIKEYNDFIKTGNPVWTCRICAESIFPFNHIVDNDVYYSSLLELTSDCRLFYPYYAQSNMFDPFDLNDEKDYIPCTDINPDSYYYNDLSFSIQQNSNYYYEDSFNQSSQRVSDDNDTLSLMHNKHSIQPNQISSVFLKSKCQFWHHWHLRNLA